MRAKPQRNWTDDEVDKLIALKQDFYTEKEIASELNRTYKSVQNKVSQIRLHTNIESLASDRWTDNDIKLLFELRKRGYRYKKISEILDRTESSCRSKHQSFKR